MKKYFCTLFDSYYLTRGLVLYESLMRHCTNFHLFIFAFDDQCYKTLQILELEHASVISLKEFENGDLLRVKPSRTIAEYCWTCTPSTILYSIRHFNLDHCTYLDADMAFFSSPLPVFEEIGNNSVGITPHNFSPKQKSSEIYGKYCVQFVYFKNDDDGLCALEWWSTSCINWCYAKYEDGKYGDQKYLDYLVEKYSNVHVIRHLGAGVAPWNIANYELEPGDNNITLFLKNTHSNVYPLIFYHYQGLKFIQKEGNVFAEASIGKIPQLVLDHIYLPYITRLLEIKNKILGGNEDIKKIVFSRKLSTILRFNINVFFRGFIPVAEIYFSLFKKKYIRPKNIGSEV